MIDYKKISIFLALFALNNIIFFTPSFGNEYYIIMFIGLIFLLKNGKYGINLYCLSFIGVAALSILVNSIPNNYHPWIRLATFTIVLAVVGPFLRGKIYDTSKLIMFWTLRWGMAFIALLSFLARLFGVGRIQNNSFYCGITVHSITLGLIAADAFIFTCFIFFHEGFHSKYRKILLLGVLLSFTLLLSSASRSATMAGLGGSSLMLYLLFHNNASKAIRYLMVLGIVLFCSFPLWRSSLEVLEKKNKGLTSLDVSTREENWKYLYELFCENPTLGVGFSFLPSRYSSSQTTVSEGRGQVEPGNSWLVILTMTGLFGGLSIVAILFSTFIQLKRQYAINKYRTALLSGILLCEILHMCGEGYILAAGGFGFFNFWCLLGAIWACTNLDLSPSKEHLFGKYTDFLMPV